MDTSPGQFGLLQAWPVVRGRWGVERPEGEGHFLWDLFSCCTHFQDCLFLCPAFLTNSHLSYKTWLRDHLLQKDFPDNPTTRPLSRVSGPPVGSHGSLLGPKGLRVGDGRCFKHAPMTVSSTQKALHQQPLCLGTAHSFGLCPSVAKGLHVRVQAGQFQKSI